MKRFDYIYNPVVYFGIGLLPLLYLCTSAISALRFGLVLVIAMVLSLSVVWLFKPMIYENVRIPCFVLIVVGVEYFVDSVVSEFWVNEYSGVADSIYYLFVATIIIFMLEFTFKEKNTQKAYINCVNIGLEYYLMIAVVSVVREILGFGTLFGSPFMGFDGSEFFASLTGAMLIVICYCALYTKIVKEIKRRAEIKNSLTDRYFAYMEQNCTVSKRRGVTLSINKNNPSTKESEMGRQEINE